MATQATAQEAVTPDATAASPTTAVDPTAQTHATTEANGGEEHAGVFPPFDPSTFASQLLWLAITFGALYLLMSRIALPQIGGILADRKARIDGDIAAADASRQKTDAAISAYEAALSSAKSKAHAIAQESRDKNTADLTAKRTSIETELSGKVTEAEARIAATKASALTHVDEIALETAQAVVTQLIGDVSSDAVRAAVAKASKE